MQQLFQARPQSTVNIDVAATTARLALGQGPINQLAVTNDGTATVWINFGDVTVVATLANSLAVRSGETRGFTVAAYGGAPYVAAIAAGSTGKIYFTPGEGI